jgi:hypothetical protein
MYAFAVFPFCLGCCLCPSFLSYGIIDVAEMEREDGRPSRWSYYRVYTYPHTPRTNGQAVDWPFCRSFHSPSRPLTPPAHLGRRGGGLSSIQDGRVSFDFVHPLTKQVNFHLRRLWSGSERKSPTRTLFACFVQPHRFQSQRAPPTHKGVKYLTMMATFVTTPTVSTVTIAVSLIAIY